MLNSKITLNLENFEAEIEKRQGIRADILADFMDSIIKEGWKNLDLIQGMLNEQDLKFEKDKLYQLELVMLLVLKHRR
jgi:hypothetical protein